MTNKLEKIIRLSSRQFNGMIQEDIDPRDMELFNLLIDIGAGKLDIVGDDNEEGKSLAFFESIPDFSILLHGIQVQEHN